MFRDFIGIRFKRTGFTLLEMTITLFIIAILILASIQYSHKAQSKLETKAQIRSIMLFYEQSFKEAMIHGEVRYVYFLPDQIKFSRKGIYQPADKVFRLPKGMSARINSRNQLIIIYGQRQAVDPATITFRHGKQTIRVTLQLGGQYVIHDQES